MLITCFHEFFSRIFLTNFSHEFFFGFFKGRMYNKEAIIEKLLNAKSEGDSGERDYVADHIRSLKDVKELQLEQNPAFTGKHSRFNTI